MMADSIEELHKFASSIGVKRHWFDKDHYDIREEEHHLAIKNGAILVPSRFLIQFRKK